MAASGKGGKEIVSSPSAGNEGIQQARQQSVDNITLRLEQMRINSPESQVSAGASKVGNSEGGDSQANLPDSPGGDADVSRRGKAKMNTRAYPNVRRKLCKDKASNDSQERSRMLGRRKRQNTNPEGPLTKKLSENSLNLSLNLGQPAVW